MQFLLPELLAQLLQGLRRIRLIGRSRSIRRDSGSWSRQRDQKGGGQELPYTQRLMHGTKKQT
ncbi:MAG TPA: hypothetical protein VN859_01590 [Steroidobacteraceae bacterium]|nr:hypothetical protein [Steroidobacteraceae bacterium]